MSRQELELALTGYVDHAQAITSEIVLHVLQPTLDLHEIRDKLAAIRAATDDAQMALTTYYLDNEAYRAQPQHWYFTFGAGHDQAGRYVKLHGTFADARLRMVELFGTRWSQQYPSAEEAGVAQFGLVELLP